MPELTDWIMYQDKVKEEAAKHVHEQRTTLLPRIKEIAYKSQTVVDHPGWQFFLDAIETRVKEIEGKRQATTQKMIFGTAMGHELELLKIELNVMDAEVAGLRYAASLIPEAVEVGHKIAGVTGQAAAASIAGSRA